MVVKCILACWTTTSTCSQCHDEHFIFSNNSTIINNGFWLENDNCEKLNECT